MEVTSSQYHGSPQPRQHRSWPAGSVECPPCRRLARPHLGHLILTINAGCSLPKAQQIDAVRLREILNYCPETGVLTWKLRPAHMFSSRGSTPREAVAHSWNLKNAGKRAFIALNGNGYFQGVAFGKKYCAHRVIWAIQFGEWPHDEVDHINGDRGDNRLSNLRAATHAENTRNRDYSTKNRWGSQGVCYRKDKAKWTATIILNGKRSWLGYHDTVEQAHQAYCEAAMRLHGPFTKINAGCSSGSLPG